MKKQISVKNKFFKKTQTVNKLLAIKPGALIA